MMKPNNKSTKSTPKVVFSEHLPLDLEFVGKKIECGDRNDGTLKPTSCDGSLEKGRGDLVEGPSCVDKGKNLLKPSPWPVFPSALSPSLADEIDPSWRWRKRYGDGVDWEELEERWEKEVTSKTLEGSPLKESQPPDSPVLSPSLTLNSDPSWRWRKRYGDDVDWEILEEKWELEVTSRQGKPSPSSSLCNQQQTSPVLSPVVTEETDRSWKWRKRYSEDVDWEMLEEKWEKEVTAKQRHPK